MFRRDMAKRCAANSTNPIPTTQATPPGITYDRTAHRIAWKGTMMPLEQTIGK
ncbi:hypothetical protein [Novosphingobium sp. KA1]|uniref:hypothetical protein n=1 Tax=Novosphingobium sp. (strain KA1) TaxID=164608 RepID=UPI001A8E57F2|nr:hypothetical protein [Novosphingobium sp. KA1]